MVLPVAWRARDKAAVARAVLEDPQDWFGVPEAREGHVAEAGRLPMLTAEAETGPVGFLCLRRQSQAAFEVAVMAVLRARHRQGCGRAMMEAAAALAREERAGYLTVKILAPMRPDEGYRRTRAFDDALGFAPLEIFPTLWGPEAPCLMMLKPRGEPV